MYYIKNLKFISRYHVIKAAISGLEATTPDFHPRGLGSNPGTGNGFLYFFFKIQFLSGGFVTLSEVQQ
jgi:hypothetical protein